MYADDNRRGREVSENDQPQKVRSEEREPNADAAFGRRIRETREARNLSQQAVSTRSKWVDTDGKGISRTALIGYEGGSSRPGARELRLLCETLNATPNYLLFGTETPFQTKHVALEGFRSGARQDIRQAVELACVLTALKDHERDALTSLALSLAGRQLGDLRLSGLRMVAAMLVPDLEAGIRKFADVEPGEPLTLEAAADALSRQGTSNIGHRLVLDEDGQPAGGEWLYPDPKPDA
ncbi:helix-turn-helix domain-containing protein [Rubrivivax sp. A210]|uniref:helix-turn-helix domain-containing protein n=1 Tax=Rubrivivax sp. A210 TaxID=2772301 RepID=UPI00191981A8|nr:helix-turn-helix transcriptional regulator [Rubrivivax sp. A210]